MTSKVIYVVSVFALCCNIYNFLMSKGAPLYSKTSDIILSALLIFLFVTYQQTSEHITLVSLSAIAYISIAIFANRTFEYPPALNYVLLAPIIGIVGYYLRLLFARY